MNFEYNFSALICWLIEKLDTDNTSASPLWLTKQYKLVK